MRFLINFLINQPRPKFSRFALPKNRFLSIVEGSIPSSAFTNSVTNSPLNRTKSIDLLAFSSNSRCHKLQKQISFFQYSAPIERLLTIGLNPNGIANSTQIHRFFANFCNYPRSKGQKRTSRICCTNRNLISYKQLIKLISQLSI